MSYASPSGLMGQAAMPMFGSQTQMLLRQLSASAPASAVWSSANRAIYVPISLVAPTVARRMWVATGATGGTDSRSLGIYTAGGVQLAVTANTVAGTASQVQFIDITDTYLSPGEYYIAMSQNGVTATTLRWTCAADVGKAFGLLMQASAYPLPAPATFATFSANLPVFGFTTLASP